MKKRYYFIGILLLVIGLFAYHLYAANNAEQQLDQIIQEITAEDQLDITVSYSSIDVNPFTGNILFADINIIGDEEIQRAGSARFDLSYLDFLSFTFRGAESGLKSIETGILELKTLSYTNRNTRVEVKTDSLHVDYQGNLWNLILSGVTSRPSRTSHAVRAGGSRFIFSQPEGPVGVIKADSLQLATHFGNRTDTDSLADDLFSLAGITWSPPTAIQQQYQFFIRGFGYETDAIPFERAVLQYQYLAEEPGFSIKELALHSELFTTTARGVLILNENSPDQSQLEEATVRIHDMSPQFQNFLDQLENLTGLEIPGSEQQVQIQLEGTIASPKITFLP